MSSRSSSGAASENVEDVETRDDSRDNEGRAEHEAQCPDCAEWAHVAHGTQVDLDSARTRIQELEEQVAIMTAKATAAVDKLADYEDKLKRLSTGAAIRALPTLPTATSSATSTPEKAAMPKRSSHLIVERPDIQRPSTADGAVMTTNERGQVKERRPTPPSKFPSFSFWGKKEPAVVVERAASPLSTAENAGDKDHAAGKTTPRSSTSSTGSAVVVDEPPSSANPAEIVRKISSSSSTTPLPVDTAFTTEHALRLAAEAKLTALQFELEDLSATLFEQANTMVAEERRLRAKTEAQVRELEKWGQQAEERIKTLSERRTEDARLWTEKEERMRKLEERVGRIERVRRAVQGVG